MPPLVGVPEIAQRLGAHRRTVYRWWKDRDDFPRPLERLSSGPVWDWEDIDHWFHEVRPWIKPGRPRKQ
jgi:predicted DNA-binding transcriptional regulator AlpA